MKIKDNVFSIAYVVLMGFGFPIMKYMSMNFSTINNNAVRFLSGGIMLFLICMIKFRRELKNVLINNKTLLIISLISLCMLVNTYFFINGIKKTNSLTASLFSILAIPVALIITALFYKDEREKIRNKNYIFGTLISIGGFIVFTLSKIKETSSTDFFKGIIYLSISIVIQTIQNLIVKKISKTTNTVVISTLTALITGAIYLAISVENGYIVELEKVARPLLITLIFSGIYGMLTGMLLAFYIIKISGITTFNLLQLLVPFSTSIVAYVFLGEKLNILQYIGGIVIILGCTLALKKESFIQVKNKKLSRWLQ